MNTNISFDETKLHVNAIHAYFQSIISVSGFDHTLEYLAAIPFLKDKALGLNYAAQYLLDYHRTLKFLRRMVFSPQNYTLK